MHIKTIVSIVDKLQFITCTASEPVIKDIVHNTLKNHNSNLEELVITELVNNICQLNPLSAAFNEKGPLGTAFQRNRYLKKHFSIVEPLEYILMKKRE